MLHSSRVDFADEGRAPFWSDDRQHMAAIHDLDLDRRSGVPHRQAMNAMIEDAVVSPEQDANGNLKAWIACHHLPEIPVCRYHLE